LRDIFKYRLAHFFNKCQFSIPNEETYKKLIEICSIKEMDGFIEYEKIEKRYKKDKTCKIYNPQMSVGKPFKANINSEDSIYGKVTKTTKENKGTRYPTSVLKFSNEGKSKHQTMKPQNILEWLIKTYSNENDTICDFTMGSGSTGVACMNLNRNFIGIEKNKDIFKVAYNRILEKELNIYMSQRKKKSTTN